MRRLHRLLFGSLQETTCEANALSSDKRKQAKPVKATRWPANTRPTLVRSEKTVAPGLRARLMREGVGAAEPQPDVCAVPSMSSTVTKHDVINLLLSPPCHVLLLTVSLG